MLPQVGRHYSRILKVKGLSDVELQFYNFSCKSGEHRNTPQNLTILNRKEQFSFPVDTLILNI